MSQNEILLESGTNELEIIEFHLNEKSSTEQEYVGNYGINVSKVLEIYRMPNFINIPGNRTKSLKGMFNYRNSIVPMIDLLAWIDGERSNEQETTSYKTIIAEFNQTIIGFKVSSVNRIHRITWEEVESPDQFTKEKADSITGWVKINDKIILLLDLEKIVSAFTPVENSLDENQTIEKKYTALIAEDSETIRKTIETELSNKGFEVISCKNGKEAWEKLQTYTPQIVISDIEMPQMDGFRLTKQIKEEEKLQGIPVILYSSMISEKIRHKGESVGADEQISKPELVNLGKKAIEHIERTK